MDADLTQEILNLKDGDHLCLFYEKDPAEQMPALVPFIHEALSKDEQFIYIADDQTVDELAGRLEQSGVDVATETDRGALKLWTRREWRQPGRFSSKKKSLQVLEFIDAAAEAGFKGSRFAVEMTWALGPDIRPSVLENWEATINTIFVPGFQGRIACQYNRSRLSPEIMLAAFHTHPLAILGAHVYPNWFYEAPLLLGQAAGKDDSVARLDWMISVLERSRAAQQEREELIEKRAALAQAEASKNKIENVLSLLPAAVYTCDAEGRITFFNRQAVELWGRAPALRDDAEKFCGSFRLWRADGALMQRSDSPVVHALQSGTPSRNNEVTIERPDGSKTRVSLNVDLVYDADGRCCGAINVFQDVTELRNTEEAKLRLAAIVESSDDAIVSKDLNGVITSWNRGAERLFGYTAAEAVGKSITMLIPAERADEEPDILRRIRRGERIEHYETVRQRKDGGFVDISLTVSPIKDAAGHVIGASKIARDITQRKRSEAVLREMRDELARANEELERRVNERTAELEQANAALMRDIQEHRRLEEQLRQAQKMEGIGTLAGGIAHDFNNILNIIKGYASLIEQHPSADEKISESISVIDESVERGASVVRQLLTLARKTESHLAPADVNDIVSTLANLLKQTFPKTVDVVLELHPKLPAALADPNQISQALLNLCVNARDAMPNGGKLRLKTKLAEAAEVQSAGTNPAATYVCVEVADTGTGIEDSIRSRLFEPFFTTKGVGAGTGLGLAMVYGIVRNHNGFVDVESEPQRGTTFRIYIPLAPAAEKSRGEKTTGAAAAARAKPDGRRTLLLAEDEQAMVLLLKRILSNHGYNVIAALDGEEAINLYHQHKDEIDAVLLDIGLPKMAGWDVILKLKEENPDVNVVVASGYIDPSFKTKMHQIGVNDFIAKPYTPDTILQALQALFDKVTPAYPLSTAV